MNEAKGELQSGMVGGGGAGGGGAEYASKFLRELSWRGMIHQGTDLLGLDAHLARAEVGELAGRGGRRAYIGFDPTSDSLTIGNLVPMMVLRHFQVAGHTPVVLAGGGTGLIGDPSGKSAERELRTREQVAANVESQKRIFGRVLRMKGAGGGAGGDGANAAEVVNNLDWLAGLSFLDALREVGKHFSVNMMIQKDSVRERLNNREQGISYTEFSYMLLQAYDFAHLFEERGVTLQMGGSDQWGNIVAGVDLVWSRMRAGFAGDWEGHRKGLVAANERVPFGVTTPLLTKADGGKYGKTESGAVWMTADRTSAYALYQFCLNTADADVETLLKKLTLLTREEVGAAMAEHAQNPGARVPHRALARAMVGMLHGEAAVAGAESAAAALFSGEVSSLPLEALEEVLGAAPSSQHGRGLLEGEGAAVLEVLVAAGVCKSKGEARQALMDGSVSVNGKKAGVADRLTVGSLLHGRIIALRRGKKQWHVTRWG